MPALMLSELPELARTRHHWIVLTRRPHRAGVIATVVLLVAAAIWPWPWAVIFIGTLAGTLLLRIHTWRAELIILTQKRIVRMQGVPETTTSEASLRIDRVSGARLVQTVPGKILGYGTIELEAPGQHPDTHRLVRIAQPHAFYRQLRAMIFGDRTKPDPNETSVDAIADHDRAREQNTEPLPYISPAPPALDLEK